MTQVRFDWVELRQIAAVMELLDDQSQSDHASQFAGGTLEWFNDEQCKGWIEWAEYQFWFVPVSNIAAGELDEYRELHKKNQEEIYRLRTQIEELQGRHQALDEATEQAQELDMGY
jgi:cold shock CspA family protein